MWVDEKYAGSYIDFSNHDFAIIFLGARKVFDTFGRQRIRSSEGA